jgi:hypothetical protein
MTGEKGMFSRNMEDFANFAIDEGHGVAFLTVKEHEEILPSVIADLHDEGVMLNYSQGKSNNKNFPISLQFLPESMAGRVTRMINAHNINMFEK